MVKHFIHDLDCTPAEQQTILAGAQELKKNPRRYGQLLEHKILGMIFHKSSTRTRVAFEAGIAKLGGQAIFLTQQDSQLGRGESIHDTAKVLANYLDILMIRTFSHQDVQEFAHYSTIPVINGLDDLVHPCQALTDLFTIAEEFGTLKGLTLAYIGDGQNNMAHSLLLATALAGVNCRVISPAAYQPAPEILALRQKLPTPASLQITANIEEGLTAVDVVYTDVWTSMGQEAEKKLRLAAFKNFTVTPQLMQLAKKTAIFLHCLPAHRGEEVSSEVIDGPQSRVFTQAGNRLPVQQALMAFLLKVLP